MNASAELLKDGSLRPSTSNSIELQIFSCYTIDRSENPSFKDICPRFVRYPLRSLPTPTTASRQESQFDEPTDLRTAFPRHPPTWLLRQISNSVLRTSRGWPGSRALPRPAVVEMEVGTQLASKLTLFRVSEHALGTIAMTDVLRSCRGDAISTNRMA